MKGALKLRGGVSRLSCRLLKANSVSSANFPYVDFEIIFITVGPDGLEPSTHGLKVRCSTN